VRLPEDREAARAAAPGGVDQADVGLAAGAVVEEAEVGARRATLESEGHERYGVGAQAFDGVERALDPRRVVAPFEAVGHGEGDAGEEAGRAR
jgi:hypothetical protein